MKLWTDQPLSRLLDLERDGVLYGAREKGDFFEDRPLAYEWMVKQMARRLPGFSGRFPVWAWTVREDLRQLRWRAARQTWHVQIEFEAPEDHCLVSDFHDWHAVLTLDYLALTEAEWKAFHAKWNTLTTPGAEGPCLAEMIESWERIFDQDSQGDPSWCGRSCRLQVCVDGLRAEWVRKVDLYEGAGY